MALTGTARIEIGTLRAAMLTSMAAAFTARAQTLARCAAFDPADLTDSDGNPVLNTPSLLLEIGPSTELENPFRPLGAQACYHGDLIEWRAYHIASRRPSDRDSDGITEHADPELATMEMAMITRGLLYDAALNRWGSAAVDHPEPASITSEPVDLKLAGYTCRVLRWQQAVLLADRYS
ncbi:MAG: hypothetical protein VBE63_15320 [Lamprobacter sp.]|uniref:hypothetical protein n=1 Tax=Lamprobacter sp. TaxID=3100796 RepID=UPI002B25903A|nr:hypothetical protein [Lamprobacter sp.]MEA3641294.1 hypothetical protein [Lamprobacter sp.]